MQLVFFFFLAYLDGSAIWPSQLFVGGKGFFQAANWN